MVKNKKYLLIKIVAVLFAVIVLFDFMKKYCFYYETVEEAYEAICGGHIYEVVEGNDTDYVIGNKKTIVLEKTDKGWKLPLSSTMIAKSIKSIGTITIYIAQYNYSDEYYLIITGYDEKGLEITDNRNSVFYKVDINGTSSENGVRGYYAYIERIDESYVITINGQEIIPLR